MKNSKVTSIRLDNKTILDIYNFISGPCAYDVRNTPESRVISTFVRVMLDWMKKNGIELPMYETDEDVLQALQEIQGKKVSLRRQVEISTPLKQSIIKIHESNVENLFNISPQFNDSNQIAQEVIDYKKEKEYIKEQEREKKNKIVGMIENFQEQLEEDNINSMVEAITIPVIIKKEEI